MASKRPLSVWISEIFFEDNPFLKRRAPRFLGLLRKVVTTIPHSFALLFSNFSSTYPRRTSRDQPQPMPASVQNGLVLPEWPRHPELGSERGLPWGDGTLHALDLGDALTSVTDLVFVMREVHRVCTPEAVVTVRTRSADALSEDPTMTRAITNETLQFFCEPDSYLREKAKKLGVNGLFRIARTANDIVTLHVVKPEAQLSRPTMIDIGCGTLVKSGYAGIDIFPLPGVDIVRDVEKHGLPFSDSTITHVYTAHFLEHVRSLVFVMNETHRVCCHNAIVDISVPSLLGPYAAADPTHVRLFNARSFSYFEAGTGEYAGITKGFEILEQASGFSLQVKLRVVKIAV